MWHWDQGHLPYFQFDALRRVSSFVEATNFRAASRAQLLAQTGLEFAGPSTHTPWRNYSRALRQAFLVSDHAGIAVPTRVAEALARPGAVTCDEYLFFLVCASSEPSPALQDWNYLADLRFPLLFSLKFILANSIEGRADLELLEIVGAYRSSGFSGDESEELFIRLARSRTDFVREASRGSDALLRQSRESLRVLAQLSFLRLRGSVISVTLADEDAAAWFRELTPINGPFQADRDAEIRRRANLFLTSGIPELFRFPATTLADELESGFREGGKVKRSHVTVERNAGLRKAYFAAFPSSICHFCDIDTTRSFPWLERVLDLHHLLPLSSGARVEITGTRFSDLVAICPTCHRSVHGYYESWLSSHTRKDFTDPEEARSVYESAKSAFPGYVYG